MEAEGEASAASEGFAAAYVEQIQQEEAEQAAFLEHHPVHSGPLNGAELAEVEAAVAEAEEGEAAAEAATKAEAEEVAAAKAELADIEACWAGNYFPHWGRSRFAKKERERRKKDKTEKKRRSLLTSSGRWQRQNRRPHKSLSTCLS